MSPVKEPSYFSLEVRPENFVTELRPEVERDRIAMREWLDGPMTEKRLGGMVEQWDDYCRLFDGVRNEKAVGEASVVYLWSPSAPTQITARLGKPKILLVLRHPAERAFSQYLNMVSAGRIACSFRDLIRRSLEGPAAIGFHRPFLEFGKYGEQIDRYLKLFPRDRLSIHLYEDFHARPLQTIESIFRFLEVDPAFRPDMSERARTPLVPRRIGIAHVLKKMNIWQTARRLTPKALLPFARRAVHRPRAELKMESADREWLVNYYAEDVRRLSASIGRDLSAWLC